MIAFHRDFTVFIIGKGRGGRCVITGNGEFRGIKKPSRIFGRVGRFLESCFSCLGQEVPSEGVGGEDGGAHVLR